MNSGKELGEQRGSKAKQHRNDDDDKHKSCNLSNAYAGTTLHSKKVATLLVKCGSKYDADQYSKQISNLFESALVTANSRTKGENDNN